MADYRSVHTEMWRADDWFQEQTTDARLFWVYLFTNPSASVSGIYKLPLRTMAFESGLPSERINKLLAQFEHDGKAFYQDGIIWVRKMRDYQLPGKLSEKLVVHLKKEIAKIPDGDLKRRYMKAYGYRIDTLSIPVPPKDNTVSIPRATDTETYTDTDTYTDTETDTETETDASGVVVDKAYGQALRAFENDISLLSGTLADDMADMWDLLVSNGTPDWWYKAIEVAVSANKRSWRYVRGVLQKCLTEGHAPNTSARERRNGHGKTMTAETLTSWQSPDGRERIIGRADGSEVRREPWES